MQTTVVLGGELGRRFGRRHALDLDSSTPAEAVRALSATRTGFRQYLLEHDLPGYHVFVGKRDLGPGELGQARGEQITIMPALAGAADGDGSPWWQIIGGALLVAAGVAAAVIPGVNAVAGWAAQPLIAAGASMIIGGVSQLLFRPPASSGPGERPENDPSYNFDGPVNTMAQGHPVPICYGEVEVGSQVISAGIVTEWSPNGGFGGGTATPTGPSGEPATGGACPAPWVPVLLADGSWRSAGRVVVGDVVRTQHETLGHWGDFRVEAVERVPALRWRIGLADGRHFAGSLNHRILTVNGWRELHEVFLGDELVGLPGCVRPVVVSRGPASRGDVMKITVEDAHTYVTSGFVSHNSKRSDPKSPSQNEGY